jgi:predicted translin family RNA/ssDNA-binding protein
MLDQSFIDDLGGRYATHRKLRRDVINLASEGQNRAKKAIFALHRDDADGADQLLREAEAKFTAVRELAAQSPELSWEGSYRAALEEYAEAALYRNFLRDGEVRGMEYPDVDYATLLGGLSDLTGELQRRQVLAAIRRDDAEVARLREAIDRIVGALLNMDLEGYHRNKFDQAKNSQRRAEDVLYDVSLRSR